MYTSHVDVPVRHFVKSVNLLCCWEFDEKIYIMFVKAAVFQTVQRSNSLIFQATQHALFYEYGNKYINRTHRTFTQNPFYSSFILPILINMWTFLSKFCFVDENINGAEKIHFPQTQSLLNIFKLIFTLPYDNIPHETSLLGSTVTTLSLRLCCSVVVCITTPVSQWCSTIIILNSESKSN